MKKAYLDQIPHLIVFESLSQSKKLNFKNFLKNSNFFELRFLDEKCLVRPNSSYNNVGKLIVEKKIEF